MACGRASLLRKVTRPPLAILTSTGLTPEEVIVTVAAGLGEGDIELPHPIAIASQPATPHTRRAPTV